jgi:hypothetical protein
MTILGKILEVIWGIRAGLGFAPLAHRAEKSPGVNLSNLQEGVGITKGWCACNHVDSVQDA